MSVSHTGLPRIIAVGLEAAEPTLLEKWCAEGRLPNLSRLISDGCFRRLHSCTAVASGATWPSITTGVSPAKHGMGFYHRQLRTGTYRIVKKYADEIRADFFWKHASAAGKRVALFDVPATRPLEPFNGIQIIGWGAEALNWAQCSAPANCLTDILHRFGRHPLDGWYQGAIESLAESRALLGSLLEGTRARTRIARWLLGQEAWDLLMVVYPETHWAGHYFFHLLEESHPRYDPQVARECGGAIFDVYREIDAGIGELTRAQPGSTVLVFSNTGMGCNYSGRHLVAPVLQRLGMAGARPNGGSKNGGELGRRWGGYAIQTVESLVSAKNIERVRRFVPEKVWDKYTRIFLNLGSGWRHSRAFALPSDYAGAVRVNLQGREPHGTVRPGDEYDRLCDELTREFLSLINPATGQRAVTEVFKPRDRYVGPGIDELPDLIVQWEGTQPIDTLCSERVGRVSGILPDNRSGAHNCYGFLVASGERIRKAGTLAAADIVDIAPTVLHLLGLVPPRILDGRVLKDMIEPEARDR